MSHSIAQTSVREDLLRDPRYPLHRIADRLLPYLEVLVDRFHPEKIMLFGSYAYGKPDSNSDVDLLVIKDIKGSSISEKRDILKAWRNLRWSGDPLPLELLVVSPADHESRLAQGGGFYRTIVTKGLSLL